MPWTIRIALLASGALLLVSGMGLWEAREPVSERWPTVLRVAVLPSIDPDDMRAAYASLVEHIHQHVGVRCELLVPKTHAELVERFAQGEFDIAWFDSLTFLRAELACGAVPLVMRKEDERMTTVVLAQAQHEGKPIMALVGGTLALGDTLSTAGHLMARAYLDRTGIDLKRDFPGSHPHGGHDETALHVRDGQADAGFASYEAVERMYREGTLSRDDVVILDRTTPYVGHLWAAQRTLARDLRAKISDALLALERSNPSHRVVLASVGASGYLPVWTGELDLIRDKARQYGVLGTP